MGAAADIAKAMAAEPGPVPTKETTVGDTPTAEDLANLQGAIDAAVAAAKGPLEAQLADLQAKLGTSTADAAVAAATAELQGQLDRATTELGVANAKVAAFETEKADFEAAVAAKAQADADAAALAEVATARQAVLVAELAEGGLGWDAPRAEARIAALAKYDDEQWDLFLEEQRATAAQAAGASAGTPAPAPAPLPGAGILGGGAPQAGAEATAGATTPPAPAQAGAEGAEITGADVLRHRKQLARLPR